MEENTKLFELWEEKLNYLSSNSFESYLVRAIANADLENLGKLYKGFPKLVNAYCVYSIGRKYK